MGSVVLIVIVHVVEVEVLDDLSTLLIVGRGGVAVHEDGVGEAAAGSEGVDVLGQFILELLDVDVGIAVLADVVPAALNGDLVAVLLLDAGEIVGGLRGVPGAESISILSGTSWSHLPQSWRVTYMPFS